MDLVRATVTLAAYTADQWGLVASAQATAAGVDAMTLHRMVAAGLLERVRQGCYLATVAPVPTHLPEKAAWLLLNPTRPTWRRTLLDPDGGVVSHASAAAIHGLGDLPTGTVWMTVPRRRATRDKGVKLRKATLTENEVAWVDGLAVTTIERTIVDLLNDHHDGGHVGQVIHDAVLPRQADLSQLAGQVAKFAHHYGASQRDGQTLLADLLAQAGYGPEGLASRPTCSSPTCSTPTRPPSPESP